MNADNISDIKKKKRCIAFDMNTKALQKYYKDNNWRNAYNDIGLFLDKQGFTHEQGSVYDSKDSISNNELTLIINSLFKRFKWFPLCVKSIRGYERPEVVDYTPQAKDYIDKDYIELISIAKKVTKRKTRKSKSRKNRNNENNGIGL